MFKFDCSAGSFGKGVDASGMPTYYVVDNHWFNFFWGSGYCTLMIRLLSDCAGPKEDFGQLGGL